MRHMLSILVLIVALVTPAAAQNVMCGNGLPCGNIPWALPAFPALPSPTHIPTTSYTSTPSSTPTPAAPTATRTPTVTYTPSITPTNPVAELGDSLSTLSAGFDGTPGALEDFNGTPVSIGGEANSITANATLFFGYVKGVANLDFGKITPLIVFSTFVLVIVVSMKVITFLLPMFSMILQYIVRMVAFVIEMILKAIRGGIGG